VSAGRRQVENGEEPISSAAVECARGSDDSAIKRGGFCREACGIERKANDEMRFGWACVKQDGEEMGRLTEDEIRDEEKLRMFVGSAA